MKQGPHVQVFHKLFEVKIPSLVSVITISRDKFLNYANVSASPSHFVCLYWVSLTVCLSYGAVLSRYAAFTRCLWRPDIKQTWSFYCSTLLQKLLTGSKASCCWGWVLYLAGGQSRGRNMGWNKDTRFHGHASHLQSVISEYYTCCNVIMFLVSVHLKHMAGIFSLCNKNIWSCVRKSVKNITWHW